MEIIDELISILNKFHAKKIYPITFRLTKEITNEYGVLYFEAISEDNKNWTIQTEEILEIGKIGMMHTKTERTAIYPQLVTKFW